MVRSGGLAVLLALAFSLFACAEKNVSIKKNQNLPPNARSFAEDYDTVWKATVAVIQTKLLIPLISSDPKQRYFISELVRTNETIPPTRFRVMGSFDRAEGLGTVLTLQKQTEVWTEDGWKNRQSDFIFERNVFAEITAQIQKIKSLP